MFNKTSVFKWIKFISKLTIEFGKPVHQAKNNSLILFPYQPNLMACGICALVAFKGVETDAGTPLLDTIQTLLNQLQEKELSSASIVQKEGLENTFYWDSHLLTELMDNCQALKTEKAFSQLFFHPNERTRLSDIIDTMYRTIDRQASCTSDNMAGLDSSEVEMISRGLEKLADIGWCLKKEIFENITLIDTLSLNLEKNGNARGLKVFKRLNAVLNSIDRLEVRGRDSAGISLLFTFTKQEFERFREGMIKAGLSERLKQRTNHKILTNNSLTIHDTYGENNDHFVTISFVYKFAAEIGSLGDNVAFIRSQVKNDLMLQLMTQYEFINTSISSHTRWASIGDINVANCHPQDNTPVDREIGKSGIIHVCLNGDIDNYRDLKKEYEARYENILPEINTDTKMIPLQVEHYLKQGHPIEEAFRLALNDFEGSHAISLHTDLAPGKLFLGQKGSGQTIFVGLAKDHYIAASELYGVVEETQDYVKLNGEDKGQIVMLDPDSQGGVLGITSMYYDGSPIAVNTDQVLTSQITSRDIDRQDFPHYFLKEISESPGSVEKTLLNKFRPTSDNTLETILDETMVPRSLKDAFKTDLIKKIFFIGQGTAGIAAQGCADLMQFYLKDKEIDIRALKSSELSGFNIDESGANKQSMENTLVVAISQSGTTTDTNRTVDMVKECGAKTLCIVNRRDSDLTFKTDGVLYTSSGRDVEMSVASTKAFYSQIAAGAVLGLHIAAITQSRSLKFITGEIIELKALPDKMRAILEMREDIKASASRQAVSKHYWATVGSGSNKTSADEIRIKLSELCYKTISSDFIEDKKHIDLSSEPLIIICAAGTRESVLGDIIKDTAIFHAHKASPIVITTKSEDRFDLYAEDVFKIPETSEHFAPVLNTLVGHIWGYYAALAINEGSRFMYQGRDRIKDLLEEYTTMGHDVYEVLLEKRFRESVAQFYNEFSSIRKKGGFPVALGLDTATNITLLLKYLSGRLPVSDFEIDFSTKGTPSNMLDTFFDNIGTAINAMARPVDAIKHQAKTVTVGTSRIAEKFEGIVFDELTANDIQIGQITNKNVLVIKNLQEVIETINGGFLYQISGLTLLGDVTDTTRIKIINKTGALKKESSRVETDHGLKGTKNIIVREGNVYIGKGRKDNKNILVIPVISSNPATPNIIEYILSLNINFKTSEDVSLLKKIKALGGKYNRLKDWIMESSDVKWDDKHLNLIEVEHLFGYTAEKVVEEIISQIK